MARISPARFGRSLMLAALALGVGQSVQAQTPQRGGVALFALSQDPTSVNPATSTNVPDRQIGCIVYPGLVLVTPDFSAGPMLARSWTISPDGKTYSFDLAKTTWHDGKPFTSEDVKYSLTEINSKYSAIFSAAGKLIEAIDTPAPDKVVMHLSQAFGPFILSMSCQQGGSILPAHLFRGTNILQNPAGLTAPVGTGAFKLQEWKRGDYVRLVRNDNYLEPGKPYLDEVVGKVIPQGPARVQALIAGEIDTIPTLAPASRPEVEANPNLKIETSDIAPSYSVVFLNTAHKPLDNKIVRQALMMATDRPYLIKNAFFNLGTEGQQPFTTDVPWTIDPKIDFRKMYPFDTAKANQMLDEAGFKRGADGKRFGVHYAVLATQYPELQQTAVATKSMWQAIGVDVTIDQLEDATMLKKVYQDLDFDITSNSYTAYADPAFGIARAYVSASIGKPFGNPSGWRNAQVDELFDKAEKVTAREERATYYNQAQEILADELPTMMIRQYRAIDAASKRLNGLWGVAQGNGSWPDAWLSK